MKIYFAGAIRGGRDDAKLYNQIITHVQTHGTVLTEHLGSPTLQIEGEKENSDQFIHDRDIEWILDADCIIAEVSTPSLGVGYEVGRALEHKKPILCLFRKKEGANLISAMIAGSKNITTKEYFDLESAKKSITEFLTKLG